jgi:hypothetical protein
VKAWVLITPAFLFGNALAIFLDEVNVVATYYRDEWNVE